MYFWNRGKWEHLFGIWNIYWIFFFFFFCIQPCWTFLGYVSTELWITVKRKHLFNKFWNENFLPFRHWFTHYIHNSIHKPIFYVWIHSFCPQKKIVPQMSLLTPFPCCNFHIHEQMKLVQPELCYGNVVSTYMSTLCWCILANCFSYE